MTNKILIASLFYACALWSQPPAAGPPTRFKGTIEGPQTVTPLSPPFILVELHGHGNATELGLYSIYAPHTVNTGVYPFTAVGTYSFTAANGDLLTASFTGTATQAGTKVSIVENGTITGGTGRFAGATGTFRVDRGFDFATSQTEGTFDGTIVLAK